MLTQQSRQAGKRLRSSKGAAGCHHAQQRAKLGRQAAQAGGSGGRAGARVARGGGDGGQQAGAVGAHHSLHFDGSQAPEGSGHTRVDVGASASGAQTRPAPEA